MKEYIVAIDIGAGHSAKIAFCPHIHEIEYEDVLYKSDYGETFDNFADALIRKIEVICFQNNLSISQITCIGISCAGILSSTGAFLLVNNMPHFNGYNLKEILAQYFAVPVGIENDANAGGLAEWSVLRVEILYWVFGGGWGGAWISNKGKVLHPALDWNGRDETLHYTNEPGYSIPLKKMDLKPLFYELGSSYDRFEQILLEDAGLVKDILIGPQGDPDTLRAETILSGPGRCRLFKAIVGDEDFYENFLDIHEIKEMTDPSIAGRHISKLSRMRVEAALNTDRLYGKILAIATRTMIKTATHKDSMDSGLPICLGGKPSYALPYFGPSAQRFFGKMGLMNYMRPSVIDERGSNANLVGAAVLGEQTLHNS